jgi:hypothetical protein
MLDQVFEMSRKALESSMQMQQAVFKHWTQDLPTMTPMVAGLSTDWGGAMRKRWVDLVLEALNKHRESVDSNYRALIHTIEKAFRVPEARSSEDAVRAIEDVWKSMFDSMKSQSEVQFREFQSWTEKAMDMARKADGAQ